MKGVLFSKLYKSKIRTNYYSLFFDYFALPLRSGLISFCIFLSVLFAESYFTFLLSRDDTVTLKPDDFVLALFGFLLGFLIKFLKNFTGEK